MAAPAHRVLSLLPAAAETLWAAGGVDILVGRGHEDDYPPSITSLPVVTAAKIRFTTSAEVDAAVCAAFSNQAKEDETDDEGMYSLNKELIRDLRPSVILTQGLCSVCAVSQPAVMRIARSLHPVPNVISLSPMAAEDIIADVIRVGKAVGLEDNATAAAEKLSARMRAAMDRAKQAQASRPSTFHSGSLPLSPNVCFMEWTEPIYVGGHWTPQLIHMAGGRHPLNPPLTEGGAAGASVRKTAQDVTSSDPDVIIVCPCGLDIPTTKKELAQVQKLPWWQSLRAVKSGMVALVDGHHMFNRSGPRIVDALEFLVGYLHSVPELIPVDFPWEPLEP